MTPIIKADLVAADRVLKANMKAAITLIREGRDAEPLLRASVIAVTPLLDRATS